MAELNIGALTDSKTYTGNVGTTNIFDLYKFNITSPGSFKFAIDGLSGNADIFLLNNSGATLYTSANMGTSAETISVDSLVAGEYSVKVLPITGDIKYTLSLAPTNTQKSSDVDTLTGAKSDPLSTSSSSTISEKATANKDVITGTPVDNKTVTAEAKPATADKQVSADSQTSVKSEPDQTGTTTVSTTAATPEKPVTTGSETTIKSEPEKPVTATVSATPDKIVTASSETAIKSEAEKTVTTTVPATSATPEKPVTIASETTIKSEPEKAVTAGEIVATKEPKTAETVATKEPKTAERVAAATDASKPAEKPSTTTTNGEDKKTENPNTSIPTAETTKELDPPTKKEIVAANPFTSGTFVVDKTGKVGIDYLLDGGLYRGQLAIISLKGMDKFVPGSTEFIKEATSRALSNSEKGHIVIDDLSEGARFAGNLPEGNYNEGAYLGVKTFAMTPGDEFGIMIVPNDTFKFLSDYPTFGGDKRPLFSMVTANPNEAFHLGQIADITGEGNTFAMEDMRFDAGSDKDYNDITFQVRGAKGKAPLMDSVVNPDKDWRKTDLGKAVIAYAKPYITPEQKPNVDAEVSDLLDDLEKEILNPSTSEKETPKTPVPAANTDKNTTDETKVVPTDKVEAKPTNPAVTTEKKVKDTGNNSGDLTKVETTDKVDTKPTGATTIPTADKDTAADSTEKLPVEKTPVPAATTEVKDQVTEAPATATLPAKSTTETEVAATIPTEKVETKPEVLPAETLTKVEAKPEVMPAETLTKVETKPEVLPAQTLTKDETKPSVMPAETLTKDETKPSVLPAETQTKDETKPSVLPAQTLTKVETKPSVLPAETQTKVETKPSVLPAETQTKVETKPEVLPAETKAKEEAKSVVVTEVEKTETPQVAVAANPVKSVKESQPTAAVESKETPAIVPPTAAEIMPVVGTNSAVDLGNKEIVTQTETAGVNDAAPKESLPISPTVAKPTEDTSTAAVTEPAKQEVAQNKNDVNADWIARLESIKQRLSNLGGADVVAENAIDRTLIARLEAMTEKLREQTRSTPVSDNTAGLISRLEDMVVQVAPKPVEPVQPVQFEFPVANRPLVGFITDTGLTVNNPAEEKSPIVATEKPANSTNNPSASASVDNNSKNPILATVPTDRGNGTSVNGVNNNPSQPVVRTQDNSSQWVESLIKFVDEAKVSKQPHAVVNININLTQTQPDGTVIPRKELTAAERSAIAYAYQNNVIVVVPAGDNPSTMSALGLLSKEVDNVVTVGAAQRFNDSVALSNAFKLADYSGSGNTLDILAKGSSDNTSSTKVAAVEVTNAIAQVLAANPKLNYTQAIDIIKRTATDLDRPNWDAQTGSGLLNVAAAVQLAKATTPELYTIKPGLRSITDVFISQHPSAKQLPGNPTHPTVKVPGIPQTNVDRGSNNLANATQLIPSATEDVIDQVSSVDPSDIYRVDSRYLNGAKFSVLSGDLSVSYLTTSGQLLGTQSFSKGSHKLQLPANAPAEVIVKIDQRNATPATYVLSGFESTATEPFNIDLEYETPLSASQQAIMQAAAKSVAGLIGKGLPSAVVDGKIIDDINIKISTANIDGASGTQARTKIDFMRYGSMLPAQSLVQFDAADIAELERSGKLFSVVQHEFLHALGFGNLWEAKGLVDYAGTPLAQYNGGKAVDAFKDLGGLTDAISLETEGKGSAGFHWNEALFQDEVMTADLNFSGKAGNAPISPVTIASLADLGYEVNLNGATPDFGLFGGGRFNAEDLTPEQIEAFRQLAEIFDGGDEPSEPAILQEVDPTKVAPEIWAHAERAPNGQYYDWQRYKLKWGDTLSGIAAATMGSGSATNYWWIANRNGIPNPDRIYEYDTIDIPVHRPNYEQQQEAERQRREQELRERQEREARERREAEDRARNNQAEQERIRQDEERRRREAEANQRALEEQARRLAEEQERRRREREEYEREQARLAELRRLAEIARQQGKGGLDWYLAKPMPEFGPVDPFQTSLTGETVGNLVPDDYYRFTLSRGGRITAELRKLLADADLVLYDARNEPIAYSMREGITDEQIIADLIPGTYMLRVNSPKGVTTDYELIVKFQHKLSATQTQPLPPGWRPSGNGNSGGSGGGNTSPGVTFADPRIKQIYNTALNQFETAERGKANARIRDLEAEKRRYQQELEQLLAKMNDEQRAKIHAALDGVRNQGQGWVNDKANGIKGSIDGTADSVLNQIDGLIPSRVYDIPGLGDRIRGAKDSLKGAINGARSWLKDRVNDVQSGINGAISWFVEQLKNAYRTGAEINDDIERLSQELKNKIDDQVRNLNNSVDQFKGKVIGSLGFLRNVGVDIPEVNFWGKTITPGFKWNFYDSVVTPLADQVANPIKNTVTSVGNSLKGAVDFVKPLAQGAVAEITSQLFGDETGKFYNKIKGVDQQIANIRAGVEQAIAKEGNRLKGLLVKAEDLLSSVLESPQHVDDILGEVWDYVKDHWVGLTMVAVGLITAEVAVGLLAAVPEPTLLTKVASVSLQSLVIAMIGTGVVVEFGNALSEAEKWWDFATTANGDREQISEASRSFVRMIGHAALAIMATKQFKDKLIEFKVPSPSVTISPARMTHIIDGEISSGNNITGGLHTDKGLANFVIKRPDVVGNIVREPLPNGVERVTLPRNAFKSSAFKDTEKAGHPGGKTIFPKSWSNQKIENSIHKVVAQNNVLSTTKWGGRTYEGIVDGVKITVSTDGKGNVQTAYPSWEQP
jgi:hypothetical protein